MSISPPFLWENVTSKVLYHPQENKSSIGLDGSFINLIPETNSSMSKKGIDTTNKKGGTVTIEDELQDVASKYGYGKCKEAAKAMATVLKKHKKKYEFARLLMIPRDWIASKMYPRKEVAENGEHWGIIYNGKIYCNIHPAGLTKEMWKDDFYGRYPIRYEEFKIIR